MFQTVQNSFISFWSLVEKRNFFERALIKTSTFLQKSRMTEKKKDSKKVSGLGSQCSRKQLRKGENPIRFVPPADPPSDYGHSNSWICKNSACRAVLSKDDTFCRRCSCCICHLFDDNKDPSLWLVCSESSQGDSCGLSCHIECALHHEKVGVVDHGQLMQLDGGYCCASCGKVTGILGWVIYFTCCVMDVVCMPSLPLIVVCCWYSEDFGKLFLCFNHCYKERYMRVVSMFNTKLNPVDLCCH